MLPISKSELDAIVAELTLGGEGETEEEAKRDLAKRIAHALLDVRNGREAYGYMVFQRTREPQVPNVYGPWATVATANKNLPAGLEGDRAVLVKIHTGKAES